MTTVYNKISCNIYIERAIITMFSDRRGHAYNNKKILSSYNAVNFL